MKFKISHYKYPLKIYKLYRFLQKSRYYSFEQLKELQNQKLRSVISHAYHNVPYYRETFDKRGIKLQDIKTTDDLIKLPVLTKEILRERFDDLVARNHHKFRSYVNRTSGSTGTPLKFLQDKYVNIARFAFFWRIWQTAGYQPYMRWAQIDGMHIPQNDDLWHYNRVLNSLRISAFALNPDNCLKIWNKIASFQPFILRGYPTALYTLASYAHEYQLELKVPLKSVITYSETLHSFQRTMLNTTFKCPVFDVYSSWEAVCLISECEKHTRHQHMEFSAMELLDDDSQPVKDRETGEITATSFYNYAMPFIRYKTGDLAQFSDKGCACGRQHPSVRSLEGRKDDIIITPEGNRVSRVSTAFADMEGLRFARIVQYKPETLEIKLVTDHGFNKESIVMLEKELRKRLGDKVHFNFSFVEDIPPAPNGKRQLVVNHIKK